MSSNNSICKFILLSYLMCLIISIGAVEPKQPFYYAWYNRVQTWVKPVFSKAQYFFHKNTQNIGYIFAGLCASAGFYAFFKTYTQQKENNHSAHQNDQKKSWELINPTELNTNQLEDIYANDASAYKVELPNERQKEAITQEVKSIQVLPQSDLNCGYHAIANSLEVTEDYLKGKYLENDNNFSCIGLNENSSTFQELQGIVYKTRLEEKVRDLLKNKLKTILDRTPNSIKERIPSIARAIASIAVSSFETALNFDLSSDDIIGYVKAQLQKNEKTECYDLISILRNNTTISIAKPCVDHLTYLAEEETMDILRNSVRNSFLPNGLLRTSDDIADYISMVSPTDIVHILKPAYDNFKKKGIHSFIVNEPTANHWYTLVALKTMTSPKNPINYYLLDSLNPDNNWKTKRPTIFLLAHNLNQLHLKDN